MAAQWHKIQRHMMAHEPQDLTDSLIKLITITINYYYQVIYLLFVLLISLLQKDCNHLNYLYIAAPYARLLQDPKK